MNTEPTDLRFFDEKVPDFNILGRLRKLGREVVEVAQAVMLGFISIDKDKE